MSTLPSNRTLLIPGKNALGSSYLKDAQTLEIWARQPIQQLVAGSGVTLSPASGLATDAKGNGPNPITISAAGGGGGPTSTLIGITTGPDTSGFPYNLLPFAGGWRADEQITFVELFNTGGNPPVGEIYPVPFGISWLTVLAAGQTACGFPDFGGVQFTTSNIADYIDVSQAFMWASNADFTSAIQCTFSVPPGSLISTAGYQVLFADTVVQYTIGADLSLIAGSTGSGDGIVSAGGGAYFAGISGWLGVPSGTTFTNP